MRLTKRRFTTVLYRVRVTRFAIFAVLLSFLWYPWSCQLLECPLDGSPMSFSSPAINEVTSYKLTDSMFSTVCLFFFAFV